MNLNALRIDTYSMCTAALLAMLLPFTPASVCAQTQDVVRVIDIGVSPDGLLLIGTNGYAMADADKHLPQHLAEVDAVAMRGFELSQVPPSAVSNLLIRLAGQGLPVFIVDAENESQLAGDSNRNGKRTLTLNSDQLTRLISGVKDPAPASSSDTVRIDPILFSSVDIDEDTGDAGLSRLELGILGRKVWFVHEAPANADGDDSGTTGIRFKQAW